MGQKLFFICAYSRLKEKTLMFREEAKVRHYENSSTQQK